MPAIIAPAESKASDATHPTGGVNRLGPVADALVVGELVVTRWRRYGKDRLYVNGPSGQRVGWVDLQQGTRFLEDSEHAEAFTATVDDWLLTQTRLPTQRVPTATQTPAPAAWHDLAENVPGQAVRRRAEHELALSRERTRVGTFVARALDLKTDERAWRVGAVGEETIGARLNRLDGHGWHVLHAVPVGTRGSDIDHVLIGTGGVYTVNTKRHPDGRVWVSRSTVLVNGHRVPYLRNARHEAERATQLLSRAAGFPASVRPTLVFLTGTLFPNVTIKNRPDDVLILDRMQVPTAFRLAPRRLTPEQVDTIYDHARRCITWSDRGRCPCPSEE